MKTLIDSTETTAVYKFEGKGASKVVTYTKPDDVEQAPDFEAMSDGDYMAWLEWLGDEAIAPSPLQLAEAHVSRYFSTPRLLQMKVWLDTFPAEDTPKLRAVYDWTNAITIQAAQGQTTFSEPPHTFEELVAEAMGVLGVAAP